MSRSSAPLKRNLLQPVLIAVLILAVIGITAWTATESPALSLNSAATPTHARSFAYAEIVKPTYTPFPTQTPTSLPTEAPIASPTPDSVVYAEIIAESVSLGYSSTTAQDVSLIPSYGGNKSILVDISDQYMYVYEGDVMIYSFIASTGMNNATRVGSFSVLEKIPNAYGSTWDIWMPSWLGIYWSGNLQNGIHALPILPNGATLWEGYLGVPISYGCVVLGSYEAQLLYDWADVGTPVDIQW
jgi:lipoprotein-anchoring transpeptidase ErfK/SrfK